MKPGYKIIIAGLLVYGGLKVKALMDIAPFKERAAMFTELLKQKKPFEAQKLLSSHLQKIVSIERINTIVQEYNLTRSKELDWSKWSEKDGIYTLHGDLLFDENIKIPMVFVLFSTEENRTWIKSLKVADDDLVETKKEGSGFLK